LSNGAIYPRIQQKLLADYQVGQQLLQLVPDPPDKMQERAI
jgi:hypothetical protein